MFGIIILWSLAIIGALSLLSWVCGWITFTASGKQKAEEVRKTAKDKAR